MRDAILSGYWPGPWPCEDGGPRRTQVPPDAGAALGLRPGERLAMRSRFAPVSCMTVSRGPGEVFLAGHTGSGASTTSWIERIHPESLDAVACSPALEAGPFWPGGIAAHRNGSLYVTYGRHCHRLSPECEPLASRVLPRERPYNSLLVLPDGNLVMKDFAGGHGVHAIRDGARGSELVVLEPERLEIIARLELPEGSIARLSADLAPDGTPRVYVVGDRSAMRVLWHAGRATVEQDEAWTTPYLRFDGQTFGWDAVIEDGSAWFLDNGEGTTNFGPSFRGKGTATSPLHLVRVALEGSHEPEYIEVCRKPGGIIANPPVVDASRSIAVGYDSGNGVVSAWRYGAPGESQRLWQREQNQAGHMLLFPASGELMCYEYDHERSTEQVVVLDIESGEEKGRVAINSPMQCVVFPSFGGNRDVYVSTFSTLARVYVE